MNNLTVGLAIAGGLVLAGVVAHGAWTTRRNAPKVMRTENVPLSELGGSEVGAAETQRHDPAMGDALGNAASGFNSSMMSLTPVDRRPGLDSLIDSIAPLELDSLVSGELALAHMPTTRRAGSKPFNIEALNAQSGLWELPHAGRQYSAFQAGVQLANRAGSLNEIEFSEFVQKVQVFADAVDATPQFARMREEIARGRELDAFAGAHDAQLSFAIRARNAAWSAGFVQQFAAKFGFVAGAVPGRMVLPSSSAGAAPLLGLTFDVQAALTEDPQQTALRSFSLGLDVPQVPRSEQAFVRMREVAIGLAATMDGWITDDQGNIIGVETLDAIGADLETLYDALQGRDLEAGSPQARRLFS